MGAHAGDELVAQVRVVVNEPGQVLRLATRVERASDGAALVEGEATVVAPPCKLRYDDLRLLGLLVERHMHFDRLIDRVASLNPLVTAVVAPEEPNSLGGALLAAKAAIIAPVLVGCRSKIEGAAKALNKDISRYDLIECNDHATAAKAAVDIVSSGRGGLVPRIRAASRQAPAAPR